MRRTNQIKIVDPVLRNKLLFWHLFVEQWAKMYLRVRFNIILIYFLFFISCVYANFRFFRNVVEILRGQL